jgi:hypothetical protein
VEALATDSNVFVAGRVVGGVLATVQGVAEFSAGVGSIGGGVTACGTGVLCPAGVGAVAGGAVVAAHGASVAVQGAAAAGQQLNVLLSVGRPPKYGPKPGPHPPLPPGVKNTRELGEALGWGTGDEALDAMTPDTVNRARQIEMTPENASLWADWYAEHAHWDPVGNPSAAPRVELMRYIANMLAE